MKRRDFISGLGLAPLFGAPSFLEYENKEHEINSEGVVKYRDFEIVWSGYIQHADAEKITGFWIASHKDFDVKFSSCSGGYSGEYKLGYILNTCVLANHKFLTFSSSKEDREEEKQRALELIKEEIDNYYKPKAPTEEWKFGFTGFKNAKN